MNERGKGVACILLSSFSFACMNVLVRMAGDIPALQRVFFRNFVALLFTLAILVRGRISLRTARAARRPLFLRSFLGTLGVIFNFYAVDHLLLSDASMLNKMSPFFAVIFSCFLLKERLRPPQLLLLCLALGGCLCILKPSLSGFSSPAALIGLLSGLCAGFAYTEVRVLGKHRVPGPVIIFYFSAFSCLATLPSLLWNYSPMTPRQLLLLLLVGLSATGGQFGITAAYRCAPASEISVYDYAQILFAALFGRLFFGQTPDKLSVLGYALIFSAAAAMTIYNLHRDKLRPAGLEKEESSVSTSVFEIIGPIMIGPSSSHTAGMARIGNLAGQLVGGEAAAVRLELSPKLKATYAGHRTDAALIGGAIGLTESDPDIRRAIDLAHERGVETSVGFLPEGKYPQNTALLTIRRKDGLEGTMLGTSIGGGSIEITAVDGVPLRMDPDAYHLVVWSDGPLPETAAEGAALQTGNNGKAQVTCLTFPRAPEDTLRAALSRRPGVRRVSLVRPVLPYGVTLGSVQPCTSCAQACEIAAARGSSLAEVAVDYERSRSGFSREQVRDQMLDHWKQMQRSVEEGKKGQTLLYGLTSGHDGQRMLQAIREGRTISGGIVPEAVARAIGVMEYNGAMGCIVAAPTAGSSGIVPGAITTVRDHFRFSDDQIVDALFVAGLMGVIMAGRDVSFSGSVGGCQGEVGVSSAITAAALASLFTKEPEPVVHAMAMCLKNLLGLVCDPIAGPVEVPCIKRNAVGVANAFTSADMALSGIRSFIPPDEVIDALVDVERRLPQELKCATVGGLACTATGCRVRKQLNQ